MKRALWLCATPFLVALCSLVAALVTWPLLAVTLLVDVLWWPFSRMRRTKPRRKPRDLSAASVITVTWNGKRFLELLLPSVKAEFELCRGDHEMIVVDNGSNDGTVEWLRSEHPWVKVIALPENRYFVRGNAAGVVAATRDVLVFLNNDMVVKPGFLRPLLEGLREPDVFGVTSEVFFRDPSKRREETGRTRGSIERGWLKLAHAEPSEDERQLDYVPTLWAGGGSAAFDRRMFLEVGGFDTLYDPFYVEDMGLSYQAWKRGYRVLFTSKSAVVHEHRGTSRKAFGDRYVDNTIRRNQHLFLWRSVTDPRMTASVMALQPLSMLVRGDLAIEALAGEAWFELKALLRAAPRIPEALWKRCTSRRHYVRSDRDTFAVANSIAAHRAAGGNDLGQLPTPTKNGMRVLVLAARLPRIGHDGSWVLWRRLEEMSKRHRVTLFAFLDDEKDRAHIGAIEALGVRVVTMLRERNPMPGNLHGTVPIRLFRDYSAPSMQRAVRRVLEGCDYDVVQVEYVEMAHLVAKEPRLQRRIYVCHESLTVEAQRRGAGEVEIAAAARFERSLLRAFDRTVALSDVDATMLRALLPAHRVDVAPSGTMLPELPESVERASAPTITFVGYFKHAPNVDAAMWLAEDILPRVRKQVADAKLRLVGRNAPAAVADLAQDGVVEVAGYVEDLQQELADATVVALPLRTGGGLRGKLLEAWAAGRPVVATPVACEGLDAEGGVHCLIAEDAQAFADSIVALLRDEELRLHMGASGRLLARQRYSVSASVDVYDAAYRELAIARGEERA